MKTVSLSQGRPAIIASLLFISGLCALVYQTVWLREFRLIFGTSTAASAAVLAIFMGGLGAGSIILGRRADKVARPLRYYAVLELLIAGSAALSPFLLWLVRAVYLATGGSTAHSPFVTNALRLLLSILVLALPTFLMGGTLPAAGRAIETTTDSSRRRLAIIYGTNTLGAVLGVILPTFFLLERFGNRLTLWLACALNVILALLALQLSARSTTAAPVIVRETPSETRTAPVSFILIAAGIVGFIFFLMELVWYRMMSPLLGGSTFSFGIILAVALLGVGIGSALYAALGGNQQPRLNSFALTCAAEAFLIALPLALGDRIVVLALLMRTLGALGFFGHVLAWVQITALVVLPAAIVAGIQFPMLIALLGKGTARVGRHIGLAYAFNTLGAIAGSLAGGFGLLPALSAPGVWRLCIIILIVLVVATWITQLKNERGLPNVFAPFVLTLFAFVMLFSRGPTSAWRQSAIGAVRTIDRGKVTSRNSIEEWLRMTRRYTVLQVDGIESGLGILTTSGTAFLINGKSDGHAVADGGTQVMVGLLGSILREDASRALVIGLGTGTTTGWLAANPGMERVDAVELERSVLKVAEACAPVNRNVLANPKAHIHIADAREWLLTTRQKYDLIASEPSNPYRVGVASLYTADYYRAAARALRPRGLFLQWVQAYEVDGQTIRSIYATFNSVFPVVETWQTDDADLLFIGGMEPFAYDVAALRKRIAEEPFKSALTKVWRVNDLEGVFSHYIANDGFAKEISSDRDALINSDDRNIIEFSVARTVGTEVSFAIPILREEAHRRKQDRPARVNGDIDWTRVDDQNANIYTQASRISAPSYSFFTAAQRFCALAQNAYVAGNAPAAMELWRRQSRDAGSLTEWTMMAEISASDGQPEALGYIQRVSEAYPAEGAMLLAILRTREKRFAEATEALISAYDACRTDPWPMNLIFRRSFDIAVEIAARDESGSLAPRLFQALQQPFAVNANEADRRRALLAIARIMDNGAGQYTHQALAVFEPHVPWEREFLKTRRNCYRSLNDPLAGRAEHDLIAFLNAEPAPFISDKQD